MKALVRDYLLALRSFSRIPVSDSLAASDGGVPQPGGVAMHFPGVGLLIGVAACIAFAVVSLLLPQGALTPLAAAVGCTIATVLLTGAMHEAALGRFADSLAGLGSLVLTLALAAKCALLGVLATQSAPGVLAALLAAHAVSRWAPLVLVHTLTPSGGAADGPLADAVDRRGLALAGAWCLPALVLLAVAGGVGSLLGALVLTAAALWAFRRLVQRRLQGFTADSLGGAQQVSEIAFYFGAGIALVPTS